MSISTILDIENVRGGTKFKNMANNVVCASLNWSDNTKTTQTCFSPNYLEDIEDSSAEEDAAEGKENIGIERMIIRKSDGVSADTIRFNTKLLECVKQNSLALAKEYLENGANPDATCRTQGLSVCHLAAFFGSDRILKEVIKDGANPVRMDTNGRTPLHCAAWRGTINCMRILLESPDMKKYIDSSDGTVDDLNPLWMDSNDHNCIGLSITTRNIPCNKTALELALGQLNPECANALLEAGARICICKDAKFHRDANFCLSAVNSCGNTIEKDYSDQRYIRTLEVLLQHGHRRTGKKRKVCTQYYNPKGYRIHAMFKAATFDDGTLIQLLLDAGFSPMHYDKNSLTPIHHSVNFKKIVPLKILSDSRGMEIGTMYSALKLSVTSNWLPGVAIIISKLLKKELPIDLPDDLNDTVLHLAAKRGNSTLVYNLIKIFRIYELSIDEKNNAGLTPLHESVRAGHASCVKKFLQQGALLTESGHTELHEAAFKGYHDVMDQLLKIIVLSKRGKALINAEDIYGLTPLHWASHKNSVECFERLIAAGANIYKTVTTGFYRGFTVLHMAAFGDSLNIIEYIYKDYPNMLETRGVEENPPFHIAIQHGHRNASSFFIAKGADLSDIVPFEGKPCATMELISDWQHSVKYLESLFDSYVVQNKYDLGDKRSEVTLNYKIFLPNNSGGSTQRMKIVETIFGNDLGFDELLLHPLVASYLSLEWSRLRMTFAGIVFIHTIYLFVLTALVIDIYDGYEVNRVWEYCLWAILSVIIAMELLLFSYSNSRIYLKKLEWLQKTLSTALTVWFLLDYQIDSDRELSRILAAITILSAWVQYSLLFSRLTGGFSYRIFEKVAVRAAKVILMFGWFLVIGFGLAFWILFLENSPFDTWGDSIIKTIVMMTSEFDYATLFEGRPFDPLWTTSRLLFLTFILFISIVMMNLLLTLAISDTEDLKAEGQKQKLLEQVYFLGMLDGFAFKLVCKILPKFLRDRIYTMQRNDITLYPGKIGASKVASYLSDKVVARVYQYCMDREKTDLNMLADINDKINCIDKKSEAIHTHSKSIEAYLKELTKKVDKLSTVRKSKSKKVNKLQWTFNARRKSWKRNA